MELPYNRKLAVGRVHGRTISALFYVAANPTRHLEALAFRSLAPPTRPRTASPGDAEIARTLAGDEGLSRRAETLAAIPGVGKATAAGLAGLAPVAHESGQWQRQALNPGGRARRLLHMAAVAATHHNPDLNRKYRDPISRVLVSARTASMSSSVTSG